MYNRVLKERYISEAGLNENSQRYLEKIGLGEDRIGMDICFASRSQAIDAIECVKAYDLSTINNHISTAKGYAKWCYNQGLFADEKYGILGISATDVDPSQWIKRLVFVEEYDLIMEMLKVSRIDDGDIEIIACLMAWIGIDDPISIMEDYFCYEERELYAGPSVGTIHLSNAVAEMFREYENTNVATRLNGTTEYRVIKDKSSRTFIKRYCTEKSKKIGKPVDIKLIQRAINDMNMRYFDITNVPRFTYRNIQMSGSLRRLYDLEKSGVNIYDKSNSQMVERLFKKTNYRAAMWLYNHYKRSFAELLDES